MGFFDLFTKKSGDSPKEPPIKKKLMSMSCKRVNYVAMDFALLCGSVETDETYLKLLQPVNYYALKDEYIEAAYYSDAEHEENYVIFRLMKYDKPVSQSGIYPVSKDTLREAYTRLGAVNF